MTARKLTLGAFIASLVLGAVAAFAPLVSTESSSSSAVVGGGNAIVHTTSGSLSLVASQGLGVLVPIGIPVVLTLLALLVPRRTVRIVVTALLWAFCLLGLLSIGLFFVPAAVLMTIAAAMNDPQPASTPV